VKQWIAVLGLLPVLLGVSHAEPRKKRPRKARLISFDERHPLSPLEAQKKRIKWSKNRLAKIKKDLEIERETFRVYLPKAYKRRGKDTWGLMVWMSPDTNGEFSKGWWAVCERYGLIGIGPDEAGNNRPTPLRVALALDAVHGASKKYRVDPERVYAMGFSGGGNVVCWLGYHYPDVFKGVISMAGVNTYAPIPRPDRPGKFWNGSIPKPKPRRFARSQSIRWVLFSGSLDAHPLLQAEGVHTLMKEDGFKHLKLIVAPKLAHTPPDAVQLAGCLDALGVPKPGAVKAATPKKKEPSPTSKPTKK
jgi:pimeloyl-ACP methyl ester carboxylesterase